MYRFTNGIVVYDERSKEAFLKAGYKLVDNQVETPVEEDINGDETDNDRTVEEQHSRSNKKASRSKQ